MDSGSGDSQGRGREEATRTKGALAVAIVFIMASTLPLASAATGRSSTLDNTLVVFVGAHPDDIDIAISGSLYKNELDKHPILWVVVTDGGADTDEYQYETDASRNWTAQDGQVAVVWVAPDGSNVTRQFYSADLARKRCGGYFDELNWTDESASHNSTFGAEYDWRTRVSTFVGADVGRSQLGYLEPTNTSKTLMYPDGALPNAETAFTASIAENLASEIDQFVESNGYQKSLLRIYSHAPEEVCTNSNEHPDHRIMGNAVRQAIDLLRLTYGFDEIDARWFTVYSPIDPQPGFLRVDENISLQQTQKSELAKACWETDYIHSRSVNYSWNDFPEDPGQYEYFVSRNYSASTTFFQLSPNPAVVNQTVVLEGNVTGKPGQPLNNTQVSVYLGENFTAYLYTNASGWFRASAPAPNVGTFLVNVTYAGSETYSRSSHAENLTVYETMPTNVTFTLSPNPATVGQNVTLKGNLTDTFGQPMNHAQVSIYLDGSLAGSLYTNSSGWFEASSPVAAPGMYVVNVTYAGSSTYNPVWHAENLTVYQTMPTNVTFTLSPNPATVGQSVTLKGNLTDITGNPIGNATVELWFRDGTGFWQFVAALSTNVTGWFQTSVSASSAGTYEVAVVYRDTSQYSLSYHIETLTVNLNRSTRADYIFSVTSTIGEVLVQ
ncbi:MAG: hypothetical protein ACE14S_08300 [Candidatus Bathyarchaeia archaeon]